MAKARGKKKKKNFSDCEMEVLLSEIEARKNVLFSNLGSGISNKRKVMEWHSVADAVKSAGAEDRTVSELKKKWSDIKVAVKRRVAAHRLHVSSTGRGTELPELTPFEQRVAAIIGDTLIVGILPAGEGDSDITTGADNSTKADPNEENMVPGDAGAASVPTTSSGAGCSHTPASETGGRSSGRVLTDAVLESQNALVNAVRDVASAQRDVANELRNIKDVLHDISEKLTVFGKKINDESTYLFLHSVYYIHSTL
ncbi:nuclear apoptosis-inducing factor 1-like [Polypterus senegalus]|uniref:nuclear apoptosis-inducing factor 1-like n=1 Tax=Polypterus senegalus TaxID=55291 RepID=UPI00196673F1|nr:nuclear apoptosis-inducing factor 1-like [Polypterus senegalus]XP_039630072.1 nuclear apoptosis-inducing factor 1-like [Polypterus senegalus]XP_039630073.1 nuclear apoptosis-inducing factor 1-like [Polypterus senegalus]